MQSRTSAVVVQTGSSEWAPTSARKPLDHGRAQVHVPLQGDVIISRGPMNVVARMRDISEGGARLSTRADMIQPGQALNVRLRVGGRTLLADSLAKVRWMSLTDSGAWNIGVMFSALAPKDLSAIKNVIRAKLSA